MYSVSLNGKWTTDGKATKEAFEEQGFQVSPSRLHGDHTVRSEGRVVAYIFNDQADQIEYLANKGLIDRSAATSPEPEPEDDFSPGM